MLSTQNALDSAQHIQKKAVAKTRKVSRELAKEVGPFTDEAIAFGTTALAAALSYAKAIGSVKAGKWAIQFVRRNPVVVGLSVLGVAGVTVYAMTRRSSLV